MCIRHGLILPVYFIIQFIFVTIYGSHCIILTNFYFLYTVFSTKNFQFQQIKQMSNKPYIMKNENNFVLFFKF